MPAFMRIIDFLSPESLKKGTSSIGTMRGLFRTKKAELTTAIVYFFANSFTTGQSPAKDLWGSENAFRSDPIVLDCTFYSIVY